MSDVVINSVSLERWMGPTSDVELRLTLDQAIVTPEGDVFGVSPDFVARAACSVAPVTLAGLTQYTLTIPSITLPATGNALVGRTARYSARFHRTSTGQLIQPWSGFEQFSLSATPSPVDWSTIRAANEAGIMPLSDWLTFNRSEILALLGLYVLKPVYETPVGTLDRTTFTTYTAPVISNPPTQAEVQAIADHLQILSEHLAAIITDVKR